MALQGRASRGRARPRFETPPGLRFGFDWKVDRHGRPQRGLRDSTCSAATLGYSRRTCSYTPRQVRRRPGQVHVPDHGQTRQGAAEWLTDNMSALVVVREGERIRWRRGLRLRRRARLRDQAVQAPHARPRARSSRQRFLSRHGLPGRLRGRERARQVIARIEALRRSQRDHGHAAVCPVRAEKGRCGPSATPGCGGHRRRGGRCGSASAILVSRTGWCPCPGAASGGVGLVSLPGWGVDCYMAGELVEASREALKAPDPAHYAEDHGGQALDFGGEDIAAAAAAT